MERSFCDVFTDRNAIKNFTGNCFLNAEPVLVNFADIRAVSLL